MQKKSITLIIIGLLVILVLISILVFFRKSPEKIVYSDDPKIWVNEPEPNIIEIDADLATKGDSYIDNTGQQYDGNGVFTVFGLDGVYKGAYFEHEFVDDRGNILMKVRPNFNISDGVIEGIIMIDIKDKIKVNIFVDEDWKKKIGKTNIFYGKMFENHKDFEYNEVKTGVYYDTFYDDPSRFNDDFTEHNGGILVGDITEKHIKDLSIEGTTFMRLY